MAYTQAEIQALARSYYGGAGQFNEDLHGALTYFGVPPGHINERLIAMTGMPTASAAMHWLLEYGFVVTLDFTMGQSLDSRVLFNRSTAARVYNSAGTLTSVAVNVARANANQDHDPATGAPRGFLIEMGAPPKGVTNRLLRSQEFDDAVWSKTQLTVSANAAVAPDGTMTADKLVSAAATAYESVTQGFTAAAGTVYTFSVFAKADEWHYVALQSGGTPWTAEGASSGVRFDLQTGTIAGAYNGQSSSNAAIEDVGNGWYRCSVRWTCNTSTATAAVLVSQTNLNNTNQPTGDGVSGIFAWGAQLEINAFATSYVPTAAAQAARGADRPRIETLSTIGYNPAQGSLSGEVTFMGIGSPDNRCIASFNDGTPDNEIAIVMADGASDLIRFIVTSGGVTQADISSTVVAVAHTPYKWAISWNANSFRISVNGTAGVEVTSGTVPTVNQLTIGVDGLGGGTVNGWEPTITYYPAQLSQARMDGITA